MPILGFVSIDSLLVSQLLLMLHLSAEDSNQIQIFSSIYCQLEHQQTKRFTTLYIVKVNGVLGASLCNKVDAL